MKSLDWLRQESLATIRRRESLFFPLMRAFRSHYPLVHPETELVIEGYWRTASTFVVQAFRQAQERSLRLAYHTHAAASVRRAVRWGLPTLVLVRPPAATIGSLLLKHPRAAATPSLREYLGFHRSIWPVRSGVVVATFDQATSDLGAVIDRVNARFGTSFRRFAHDAAAARAVLAEIERFDRRANAGDPTKYCTPRSEKSAPHSANVRRLGGVKYAALMRAAKQEYRRYAALAGDAGATERAA